MKLIFFFSFSVFHQSQLLFYEHFKTILYCLIYSIPVRNFLLFLCARFLFLNTFVQLMSWLSSNGDTDLRENIYFYCLLCTEQIVILCFTVKQKKSWFVLKFLVRAVTAWYQFVYTDFTFFIENVLPMQTVCFKYFT